MSKKSRRIIRFATETVPELQEEGSVGQGAEMDIKKSFFTIVCPIRYLPIYSSVKPIFRNTRGQERPTFSS